MAELRIGVLGCAHYSHAATYARAAQADKRCTMVGVHDPSPTLSGAFAAELGIAAFDRDTLLSGSGLDAAIVCGTTDSHRAAIEQAALAGLHVLCEKPLATTVADGRAAVDACAKAGVQLHVAFVSRFDPLLQRLRMVIRGGEIGDVVSIVGQCPGQVPLGQTSWGPRESVEWLSDPVRAGGGAVIDHGVHVVDAIRFLTGGEVSSVSAEIGTLLEPMLPVDDCGSLLLVLESGAVAAVDPSWSHPKEWDWWIRVLGSKGLLVIDDMKQALRVVRRDGGHSQSRFGVDMDEALVHHFIECVITGEMSDLAPSGEDGLRALEVVLAAYESAETGRPASVSRSLMA